MAVVNTILSHYISIHALREEGDRRGRRFYKGLNYFYPRPPRGGRHLFVNRPRRAGAISIHALREEGDCRCSCCRIHPLQISIHALREEGDRSAVLGGGKA